MALQGRGCALSAAEALPLGSALGETEAGLRASPTICYVSCRRAEGAGGQGEEHAVSTLHDLRVLAGSAQPPQHVVQHHGDFGSARSARREADRHGGQGRRAVALAGDTDRGAAHLDALHLLGQASRGQATTCGLEGCQAGGRRPVWGLVPPAAREQQHGGQQERHGGGAQACSPVQQPEPRADCAGWGPSLRPSRLEQRSPRRLSRGMRNAP